MKHCWPGIFLLLLLSACNNTHEEQRCYHVVKGDFTETITVSGTIKAEHTTSIVAPRVFLPTIIWIVEDGKYVEKGDTVCILEHPDIEARVESHKEEKKKLESQLEKLEADHKVQIAMLQAEIENNAIQLSITSLDSVQKQFAPPLQQKLISLKQQKANILKEKLEKKFNARKTIGESEIRSLKSRIKVMEGNISRSQDELDALTITTPKAGIVMGLEAPKISFMTGQGGGSIGGKIQKGTSTFPNMAILEIPEMDKMQVLAELAETDYKKVREGQKVRILVEAKNNLVTTGTIMRKMLTSKQQNRNSKVKYYEALIEVDSCHSKLTPGMNADCSVVLNEYKDTIVVPAVSVFEENEEKFVYVLEGKKYRKTQVETGTTSTTYCIIRQGLSNDAFVALTKPSADKIKKAHKKNKIPNEESDTTMHVAEEDSLQTESLNKSPQL
ncbi:MAG: efflux RND transporter periplasmic adaptor subunit [Bacteroidales bacterium]|nr:efflux RND transporter periplasmic adaptor subunit [Bacteroidales bacterium]